MKYFIAVVVVCIAAVQAQPKSGARPTPGGPPSSMTKPAPQMQGCSPGCSPTAICVELDDNYRGLSRSRNVCAKMSSIRFPTAALAGILKAPGAAQQPAVQAPSVPVAPGPQYYPQQQDFLQTQQQQRQGPNNLLFPLMFGGMFDMGFGF